ncbi:MAG: YfhO family protein [Candidatus Omnitrophica bacterium]|nr:YfhO family protein [Candidatus Omnitrophota bacterium]
MLREASSNAPSGRQMAGWILFSFLIWLICFQGFVSGRLSLQSDAVGYYQHVKFYIDNMVQGVYPFWDPGINGGVPNEFFLRRMGSFNPFFLIPVILRWCGMPHLTAYTTYLASYYFMAALGFYYLGRVVLKTKTAAYAGFLLFLFSSLGTRQFDSYIVLVTVPLVWFFGFLLDFLRRPRAVNVLGLTYCLMNLATTYIPLYFLIIFTSFLVFGAAYFPRRAWDRLREAGTFLWRHKVLTAVCAFCLIMAMIPAAMIFQSAREAEFVMPRRASTAASDHALAVGKQTVTEWAMLEELVYASAFNDLRRFKFAIIFFPGFIYLIFLMGAGVRINRKFLLLVTWGGFLFLLSVPALSPVYDFLHRYIFLFKYFRNLHWFFWLAMLPIFVLAAAVLLDDLCAREKPSRAGWWIGWTLGVHAVFTVTVVIWGNTIWSTYGTIAFSALFFALRAVPAAVTRPAVGLFLLTAAVGCQSLEVYHYLNVNSTVRTGPYKGDDPYDPGSYQNKEIMGIPTDANKPSLYYALRNYHDLYNAVHPSALFDYKRHKFILFDDVAVNMSGTYDYTALERKFALRQDLATVLSAVEIPKSRDGMRNYEAVTGTTPGVELVRATVDRLELKTDRPAWHFLVFNQNWHRRWQATVDGRPQRIRETNGSFMGIPLPAGAHTVTFRFGGAGYRGFHYSILVIFYAMFLGIGWAWWDERRKGGGPNESGI